MPGGSKGDGDSGGGLGGGGEGLGGSDTSLDAQEVGRLRAFTHKIVWLVRRGEPRRQHLVHRRAGREEFVEHAEASHVGRGSAVPYHEIRDVVLCVPILALARATRAAAAERVQATRERAKRWQWLYQR
eukprot:scaffold23242_cov55-Phaeocystis_antarctica.AAC.1